MSDRISRRTFVHVMGALGVAGAFPMEAQAQAASTEARPAEGQATLPRQAGQAGEAGLGTTDEGYTFLTEPEVAFIVAAVARLIPADDLGPGAVEAGVPYFIDQQLSGALGYGFASTWYMQGPFAQGTPQQGYQLPLDPQHLYRVGIAAANRYCQATYGGTFDKLSGDQQEEVLKALQSGSAAIAEIPPALFFQTLYASTMEGFFSDPVYGGNRDKVGWRLVGYPGIPTASYRDLIDQYVNVEYQTEPVSIADVLQGKVVVGA